MRFVVLLLGILVGACSSGAYVDLGGVRFSVEVASSGEERQLGLMFRDELPEDHGMLFVFPTEARRSFWMKNTRIALDILYFDADLRLVSVSENTPPCRTEDCPSYPSAGPAKYVLELNAGKASELDLRSGDRMTIHFE